MAGETATRAAVSMLATTWSRPISEWAGARSRRDHRCWALVDGVDDLSVVDCAQVHGRDPQVGVPGLPMDSDQRHAVA